MTGVPEGTGKRGRRVTFDELKAWELYEKERMSDCAIAKRVGVSANGIRSWRMRCGYPANIGINNKPVDRPPTKPPDGSAIKVNDVNLQKKGRNENESV